jgi:5-methylcytosine-specific restriction endonuclease McrA
MLNFWCAMNVKTEKKSKKPQSLKTWLIPKLRRLSYMWPNRNIAKSLARVERGKYRCNICNNIFGPKEIVMDHIMPVVPVEGFQDLGNFVESLFCEVDGYQAICSPCHSVKTFKENEQRKNKD